MKHAKRRKGLGEVLLVTAAVLMAVLGSVCAYNHQLNSFSGKADMYNMQICSSETATDVFDTLKENDGNLQALFEETYGEIDDEMVQEAEYFAEFADWENCKYKEVRSMGGAFTGDSEKKYTRDDDVYYGESWVLSTSDETYVIYMECKFDTFGKKEKGLSAIAVTTWDNYYERSDVWDYRTDEYTARIGEFQ